MPMQRRGFCGQIISSTILKYRQDLRGSWRHFARASRNLPKFRYYGVEGLNVYDLLKYNTAIITKDSIKKIVERCGEVK